MFSRMRTMRYTNGCSHDVSRLKEELASADAVVIGAGAGLSAAAGYTYSGSRFEKYFSDHRDKYGFTDMYSGGFYPYKTPEEMWAFWARNILANRYDCEPNTVYPNLLETVKDKDYFVLTTNVDHRFQAAGFDKGRLFYTQGDYGLFRCSEPCTEKTYDNEEQVRRMFAAEKNLRIPTELIPRCPVCGKPMTTNLRIDDRFVCDEGWKAASERYKAFLAAHRGRCVLFLELGVGFNTPGIIKFPFMKMTAENENAVYACINKGETFCTEDIAERSICIDEDIAEIIGELL